MSCSGKFQSSSCPFGGTAERLHSTGRCSRARPERPQAYAHAKVPEGLPRGVRDVSAGRILRVTETPAETQLAEALGIRRGRLVLRVERLGLSNGRPVVLGAHHFPLPRCAAAAEALEADPSITNALAACGIIDYRRRASRITARLPTPEEADLLQQSRSRPVLVAESLNVDPDGAPVDWTLAVYAAGRVQLVVEP